MLYFYVPLLQGAPRAQSHHRTLNLPSRNTIRNFVDHHASPPWRKGRETPIFIDYSYPMVESELLLTHTLRDAAKGIPPCSVNARMFVDFHDVPCLSLCVVEVCVTYKVLYPLNPMSSQSDLCFPSISRPASVHVLHITFPVLPLSV